MTALHEEGIGNVRKSIGYTLSVLATIMYLYSSLTKLFGVEFMLENMQHTGVGDYTISLSLLELICVVIYWIPKTSNIGFFLLASYTGGALVGELAGGLTVPPAFFVSIALYLGTMLRKPSLSGLGI